MSASRKDFLHLFHLENMVCLVWEWDRTVGRDTHHCMPSCLPPCCAQGSGHAQQPTPQGEVQGLREGGGVLCVPPNRHGGGEPTLAFFLENYLYHTKATGGMESGRLHCYRQKP